MSDSSNSKLKYIYGIFLLIVVLVVFALAALGKISWSDAVKIIVGLGGGGAALTAIVYYYLRAPAAAKAP